VSWHATNATALAMTRRDNARLIICLMDFFYDVYVNKWHQTSEAA
jgi:ribulose-5-phosphate 4-epimerase/fuculose-1-phosphate aldolase